MAKAKNTQNTTADETKQTVSNDDGFEIIAPEAKKTANKPFRFWIKLSKSSITVSQTLKNALGETIQLAFNKGTRTIRIKSTDQEPLFNCKTKINAKKFFNDYGINIEEPKKCEAIEGNDKAYYVKID